MKFVRLLKFTVRYTRPTRPYNARKQYGEMLSALCAVCGVSGPSLARALGISEVQLRDVERGIGTLYPEGEVEKIVMRLGEKMKKERREG